MTTENTQKTETKATTTKTAKSKNLCGCGCKAEVGRTFLPGHDAKLKSAMQRAFRSGAKRVEGTSLTPQQIAAKHGWERFLTDGKAKAEKKAPVARKTTPRTEAKHPNVQRKTAHEKAVEAQEEIEQRRVERNGRAASTTGTIANVA